MWITYRSNKRRGFFTWLFDIMWGEDSREREFWVDVPTHVPFKDYGAGARWGMK